MFHTRKIKKTKLIKEKFSPAFLCRSSYIMPRKLVCTNGSLEVGGVDESWVEEREEDKGERDPASMILAQKEIEKRKE